MIKINKKQIEKIMQNIKKIFLSSSLLILLFSASCSNQAKNNNEERKAEKSKTNLNGILEKADKNISEERKAFNEWKNAQKKEFDSFINNEPPRPKGFPKMFYPYPKQVENYNKLSDYYGEKDFKLDVNTKFGYTYTRYQGMSDGSSALIGVRLGGRQLIYGNASRYKKRYCAITPNNYPTEAAFVGFRGRNETNLTKVIKDEISITQITSEKKQYKTLQPITEFQIGKEKALKTRIQFDDLERGECASSMRWDILVTKSFFDRPTMIMVFCRDVGMDGELSDSYVDRFIKSIHKTDPKYLPILTT